MRQENPTYQFIRQAAQRIGRKFHLNKVVLFGSYASDFHSQESDIDLLIIFSKKGNRTQRYIKVSKELEPMPLPIDLLIRSRKDIQDRLKIGDSFIQEILKKGKVLYEH